MPTSVLLVDDHAVVRQGIRAVLEADPDYRIVGEAADGLEAAHLAKQLVPDLLVLDVMMPGLNGLDTMSIIHKQSPQARVIIFSMYDSLAFASGAVRRGAAGYVLKRGQLDEIVTAIRAVMAGQRYFSAPLTEEAIESYLASLQATPSDLHDLLTPRERQVLQLAAEGMTCPEIGSKLQISERTAEHHRANVMRKLNLATQTELIRYALRRGILPPG